MKSTTVAWLGRRRPESVQRTTVTADDTACGAKPRRSGLGSRHGDGESRARARRSSLGGTCAFGTSQPPRRADSNGRAIGRPLEHPEVRGPGRHGGGPFNARRPRLSARSSQPEVLGSGRRRGCSHVHRPTAPRCPRRSRTHARLGRKERDGDVTSISIERNADPASRNGAGIAASRGIGRPSFGSSAAFRVGAGARCVVVSRGAVSRSVARLLRRHEAAAGHDPCPLEACRPAAVVGSRRVPLVRLAGDLGTARVSGDRPGEAGRFTGLIARMGGTWPSGLASLAGGELSAWLSQVTLAE